MHETIRDHYMYCRGALVTWRKGDHGEIVPEALLTIVKEVSKIELAHPSF